MSHTGKIVLYYKHISKEKYLSLLNKGKGDSLLLIPVHVDLLIESIESNEKEVKNERLPEKKEVDNNEPHPEKKEDDNEQQLEKKEENSKGIIEEIISQKNVETPLKKQKKSKRDRESKDTSHNRSLSVAIKRGVTDEQIAKIRELLEEGVTQKDIAAKFGFSESRIGKISNGKIVPLCEMTKERYNKKTDKYDNDKFPPNMKNSIVKRSKSFETKLFIQILRDISVKQKELKGTKFGVNYNQLASELAKKYNLKEEDLTYNKLRDMHLGHTQLYEEEFKYCLNGRPIITELTYAEYRSLLRDG